MGDTGTDSKRPALRALRAERGDAGGQDGIVLIDPTGVAEATFVPAALVPVVARMDGQRSTAAIAALASAEVGTRVPEALVERIVAQLDERLLLHGERFQAARDRLLADWLGAGVRPCRHAGSAGYPAEPMRLRAALAAMVPPPLAAGPPLRGLVAPHIDLARGHAGYAAAYGRLLAAPPADLYVVFGTGHQGPGAPVTGLALDWQTPLGTVPTDRAFVAAVHDALGPPDPDDLLLHRDEHSLEFQVLLLQHLAERRGAACAVAGFLCGALPSQGGDPTHEPYWQRLIDAFTAAERRTGRTVCYVAGADLAHLGPFFGDEVRIDTQLLARLQRDERQRLQHLEQGRPCAFHAAVEGPGNADRVCSAPAITLAAQLAGGPGRLLHYGQAAAEDGSQVVSFCGIAFEGVAGPAG